MRAFVIHGPGQSSVIEVPSPEAEPGHVVVDIARVGLCGTDVEFLSGEMAYLHEGKARYPIRIGHEWCGWVAAIGTGVDRTWLGRRVTGDTMIGCGTCSSCRGGRQHVCADRREIGIRGGFPGALAERLAVPASGLHALPDSVDDVAGALVEPGGNALRAVDAAGLAPGDRLLVVGAGSIGMLAATFARARGVDVQLVGRSRRSLEFALSIGFEDACSMAEIPRLAWDAAIDASNDPAVPALLLDLVEPGRRIAYIGLAATASQIDTRSLVLKDVTAVGILSGSAGLAGAIELYAGRSVDPRPLVAATVGLDQVGEVLSGRRPDGAGPGPKFQVDPRR